MTKPPESIASHSSPPQSPGGPWRYFALFGMQTIGAVMFFWNGVPLYRRVVADPASYELANRNIDLVAFLNRVDSDWLLDLSSNSPAAAEVHKRAGWPMSYCS